MRQDFLDEELSRYKVAAIHYTAIYGRKTKSFALNGIRINDAKVHQVYECS
jgi:hypothetical protein